MPKPIVGRTEQLFKMIRATGRTHEELLPAEQWWVDKETLLHEHNYRLRPRYRSDWTPSWNLAENLQMDPESCEDAIPPNVRYISPLRSRLVSFLTLCLCIATAQRNGCHRRAIRTHGVYQACPS